MQVDSDTVSIVLPRLFFQRTNIETIIYNFATCLILFGLKTVLK